MPTACRPGWPRSCPLPPRPRRSGRSKPRPRTWRAARECDGSTSSRRRWTGSRRASRPQPRRAGRRRRRRGPAGLRLRDSPIDDHRARIRFPNSPTPRYSTPSRSGDAENAVGKSQVFPGNPVGARVHAWSARNPWRRRSRTSRRTRPEQMVEGERSDRRPRHAIGADPDGPLADRHERLPFRQRRFHPATVPEKRGVRPRRRGS